MPRMEAIWSTLLPMALRETTLDAVESWSVSAGGLMAAGLFAVKCASAGGFSNAAFAGAWMGVTGMMGLLMLSSQMNLQGAYRQTQQECSACLLAARPTPEVTNYSGITS